MNDNNWKFAELTDDSKETYLDTVVKTEKVSEDWKEIFDLWKNMNIPIYVVIPPKEGNV